MSAPQLDLTLDATARPAVLRFDSEMVELPLLLPAWQMEALEAAARRQGMTTGQMLRRLIHAWASPTTALDSAYRAAASAN